MEPKEKPTPQGKAGFALVVTLTLMVLLAILAIGLLSLSTVSLRNSHQTQDRAVARANARLALSIAISELQKQAGPDQRVTARADLLDPDSANPMWTAVWNSEGGEPAFLVSGNSSGDMDLSASGPAAHPPGYHLPETTLDASNSSLLFGKDMPADQQVLAPEVEVKGGQNGSYAYWIADEGIKARVDIRNPYRNGTSDREKRLALSMAQSNSIAYASDELKSSWPQDESNYGRVVSLNQAALLDPSIGDFQKQYFHDLTTDSEGLLSDAKNGGLKRDLTLAFEDEDVFYRWFGRKQASETHGGVATEGGYEHNVNETAVVVPQQGAEKFFISDEFMNYRGKEAGPNWGILCHYYNLYKTVEKFSDDFPTVHPHPAAGMQGRRTSWDPYTQYIENQSSFSYEFQSDVQHNNNFVAPMPSRFQMTYRLKSKASGTKNAAGEDLYEIVLEFKPVVGVWNPYNVSLKRNRFRLEWEMSPVLEIEINDPGGTSRNMEVDMTGWYGRNTGSELITLDCRDAVDYRPGEQRVFSLTNESPMKARDFYRSGAGQDGYYDIFSSWGANGYFQMPLPEQDGAATTSTPFKKLLVTGQAKVRVISLSLSEQSLGGSSSWKDTAGNWYSFKPGKPDNGAVQSVISTSRSTNIWQTGASEMAPEMIKDEFPAMSPAELLSSQDLGTWVYSLRSTSDEPGQNIRNLIDSNVRAANLNSRWDGSYGGKGLTALSPYKGEGPLGRGLLSTGVPPEPPANLARYSLLHGDGSQQYVVCFDLPHSRPLSLGHFQHAVLGRYNNEPSFVFGNSYANIRVPLDQKVNTNFLATDTGNGDVGLRTFDISYLVNEEIWDSYFLSGLSPDDSLLTPEDFKKIAENEIPAPNSRVKILDPQMEKGEMIAPDDETLSNEIAAHLVIQGAFNVNSTSVAAWRSVLAGMADLKVPAVSPTTKAKTWLQTKGVTFSRFSNNTGKAGDVWKGFQELSDVQLDALAKEIVNQVRARGPFRSLGDFVNRSLKEAGGTPASDAYDGPDIRWSGALQTALDRKESGINSDFSNFAGDAANLDGSQFEQILNGQSKAAGYAGFILQGDILQAIAPVITVRSDTFLIRATGTARDASGKITAQAWCEAIVQRRPEPLDPSFDLTANDKTFGRKFELLKFRWLKRNEI